MVNRVAWLSHQTRALCCTEMKYTLLTDNGVSRVWLAEDGWVYKRQPRFLTDNEIWCLQTMEPSGYVPKAEWLDFDLIRMEHVVNEPVSDPEAFLAHLPHVLFAMREVGIRHGDLTRYAVLVRANKPIIIDWAESRLTCDPRPDKRREGDAWWLNKTMMELAQLGLIGRKS